MDTIFLVRHAKAGERRTWTGDDELRPLSAKGRKQADRLARKLERKGATELYSSRFVRCVQTLEPLAARLDADVISHDALAEHQPPGPAIDLARSVSDRSVLCSHGDIIPAVLDELRDAGLQIESSPDWRKAATWVLRRNKHKRFVRATAWPPPKL